MEALPSAKQNEIVISLILYFNKIKTSDHFFKELYI